MEPVIIFVRFQQKLEYDDKCLVELIKEKFIKNLSGYSRIFSPMWTDRQTDGQSDLTNLVLAFHICIRG
jgi:hypothetical protein